MESVKATNPDMKCYQAAITPTHWAIAMRADRPPFNDVRVRRAVSMALDRQGIIDNLFLGYGVEQNGPIHVSSEYYLKDQGDCAKYSQYNPAEAKRLLAEAGYPQGFETILSTTGGYGVTYLEYADVWVNALAKIGINAKLVVKDYAAHVATTVAGKYEGMAWTIAYASFTDPDDWVYQVYTPGETKNASHVDDPKVTEWAKAQRIAKSNEERKQILDEVQRYLACHSTMSHGQCHTGSPACNPGYTTLGSTPNFTIRAAYMRAFGWTRGRRASDKHSICLRGECRLLSPPEDARYCQFGRCESVGTY